MEAKHQMELQRLSTKVAMAQYNYDDLEKEYRELKETIQRFETRKKQAKQNVYLLNKLVECFGPRGIQMFVLEGAMQALELSTQSYLDELSDGSLRLDLSLDSGDRIIRSVSILRPDGSWVQRSLSSLSGGQWRRCSLALTLGFSDLVSHRGQLRSSLLVLDEPFTHLDASGRANVEKVLRTLLKKYQSNLDTSESTISPLFLGVQKILEIFL